MHRLHVVCSWLLVALGALHVVLTPAAYGFRASLEVVWLAATGLVPVLTGLVNLAALAAPQRRVVWICRAANLLALAHAAVAVLALTEPQTWLALGLTAVLTVGSLTSGPFTGPSTVQPT
jgi:peptidoglycan/LPS O-acetylase OafA/YrhL